MIWILVRKYFSQEGKSHSWCRGKESGLWLFSEQGDILQQLSKGQRVFQPTFLYTVCLQKVQICDFFQKFSNLEQKSFLKGSKPLIGSAGPGQI